MKVHAGAIGLPCGPLQGSQEFPMVCYKLYSITTQKIAFPEEGEVSCLQMRAFDVWGENKWPFSIFKLLLPLRTHIGSKEQGCCFPVAAPPAVSPQGGERMVCTKNSAQLLDQRLQCSCSYAGLLGHEQSPVTRSAGFLHEKLGTPGQRGNREWRLDCMQPDSRHPRQVSMRPARSQTHLTAHHQHNL